KFICRNLDIGVETSASLFTAGYQPGQCISIPVAHNDGNYVADQATLDQLEGEDRVVFRYVDADGQITDQDNTTDNPTGNPNGSARSIAGVLDAKRRVLGFMPHPENATDPAVGGTDGQALFDGLVKALS
ncbi:MAG: phosphoribosylformylglycinamidine synthase subunit PurQ, partial [Proteobacteria bacterium]|nr:phosphoribosylformylglycinamidine synthase subunit PurQ [Pseudomonadota bacterium]